MDKTEKFSSSEFLNLIIELKSSIQTIKGIYNTASNENINLRIQNGKSALYKEDLIKFVDLKQIVQKEEIYRFIGKKSYNGKEHYKATIKNQIDKLIENKIFFEIDHRSDPLKPSPQAQKSCLLNPYLYNYLKSIQAICNDIEKLKPMEFLGFIELIKFHIKNNLVDVFNNPERKVIDILPREGKLDSVIEFVIVCKQEEKQCTRSSCKIACHLLLKDIIRRYNDVEDFDSKRYSIEPKKNNICRIRARLYKDKRDEKYDI
ncbi:MAG: hypothetical protein E3J83_06170 [Candidatus Atribacteria bacterium]|nr:MAG: hypothetical protein E3J83_06170 [Candidatus Atribacteria bacterium]